MAQDRFGKPRQVTRWDGNDMKPTQQFLFDHYKTKNYQRHPSLAEAGEAAMINLELRIPL